MSIDSSLKTSAGLSQHRNVLTRPERIAKLKSRGKFDPEQDSALGLVKVGNRKIVAGKKSKKKGPEEEEAQ